MSDGRESIIINGAREHNLRNIDVTLPRNKLIVLQELVAPENPRLHLIPFMQKDLEGI